MPRPKVTEAARQRVAKACLRCQKLKNKCDGQDPCAQCLKRGLSSICSYSPKERSYGHRRRRQPRKDRPITFDVSSTTEPLHGLNRISQSQIRDLKKALDTQGNSKPSEFSVFRPPRSTHDTTGRIVYLGECAAPSFLTHIQNALESEPGISTDESGTSRLSALEEIPFCEPESEPQDSKTTFHDLKELVDVFFTSTCGILDIFNRRHVDDLLDKWKTNRNHTSDGTAVLLLVLAYAAQARSAGKADIQHAEYYYHHGRRMALHKLTDDPKIETVQAFILISLYMLACSQRNGSFLNLGIAISAAKSLGFHRDDINAASPESSTYLRSRIWATLRYHDLFFCAMMGRTPCTITTDANTSNMNLTVPGTAHSDTDINQQLSLSGSARAFSFMESIIPEMYSKETVSMTQLQHRIQELHAAAKPVPVELRKSETVKSSERCELLKNAYIACSYDFSMMLLTRPFLVSSIQMHGRRKNIVASGNEQIVDPKCEDEVRHTATASIDAAMHTIQLLHNLKFTGVLYNNMPLVVAWVFVASLTICSAYFGQLQNKIESQTAIQQAEEILTHFSRHSRQGKRYCLILNRLHKAAKEYVAAVQKRAPISPEILMADPVSPKGTFPNKLGYDESNTLDTESAPLDSAFAEQAFPQPIDDERIDFEELSPSILGGSTEPLNWDSAQRMLGHYHTIPDVLQPFDDNGIFMTSFGVGTGPSPDLDGNGYIYGLNWCE